MMIQIVVYIIMVAMVVILKVCLRYCQKMILNQQKWGKIWEHQSKKQKQKKQIENEDKKATVEEGKKNTY